MCNSIECIILFLITNDNPFRCTQMYSIFYLTFVNCRYFQTMHVKERFFPWMCIVMPPKMAALGLDH